MLDYWGSPNFEPLQILQHTICCSRYPTDNQHSSSNGVGRSLPSICTCLVVARKNDRFSLKEHLFRKRWFLRLDFGPMVLTFSMLTLCVWLINPECHFHHQISHQVILLQLAHRDGDVGFSWETEAHQLTVGWFFGATEVMSRQIPFANHPGRLTAGTYKTPFLKGKWSSKPPWGHVPAVNLQGVYFFPGGHRGVWDERGDTRRRRSSAEPLRGED